MPFTSLRDTSWSRWDRIRQRVIRRANGLCEHCTARGQVKQGREVDHIKPVAQGGTDDDDNLQYLCIECHERKTCADEGKRYRPTIGLDGWPVA